MEIRKRKRLRRRLYSSKGPKYVWHMDSYDEYEDVMNLCNCNISENNSVKDDDPYNLVNFYIKLRTEMIHILDNIILL